jgi:hypothetical protein
MPAADVYKPLINVLHLPVLISTLLASPKIACEVPKRRLSVRRMPHFFLYKGRPYSLCAKSAEQLVCFALWEFV